ncbi:MAG: SpoIID/LytB domain-containing protein [Gemmatimonadetes bacterium]|nr:SpoIID/LytB domain-containing protein [Gemmatimonadota bacterium]
MRAWLALACWIALPLAAVAGQGRAASARGGEGASEGGGEVRVVVGAVGSEASAGAQGGWRLTDAWGRVHAQGSGAPDWVIERRNRRVRVAFGGGTRVTAWSDEPFVLEPAASGGAVTWNGRRYRGTLAFAAVDTAILVINRVDLEGYLRGVLPLELGVRSPNESPALEAQAIAARSYTVVRLREGRAAAYDLTSGAFDQVYGGLDVEHPIADAAVAATEGLVLSYNGAVVRAPYHSTCGGHTVASTEAWSGVRDEPYLRGVSDARDGGGAWCDISPRFRWERTFDRRALDDAVSRYVRAHGAGMLAAGGSVREARIEARTRSGRVASLVLETDGGAMRLSGTEMRTTLRTARGEILNSTYFSLEPVIGRDGRLMQLTLRGSGNGHGVGMCQWGAIGRARAGHDVRSILAAYYPGTVLVRLP